MRRLILIFVVLLVVYCVKHDLTPDEIMGMRKIVCASGDEALKIVKEMHVGEIRYVQDITLLHYVGEYSFVTVWVTVYPNESVAFEEMNRMASSMVKFGWKNLSKVEMNGYSVYVVVPPKGKGKQYFWCVKNVAYYIIPHNMTELEIRYFILNLSSPSLTTAKPPR